MIEQINQPFSRPGGRFSDQKCHDDDEEASSIDVASTRAHAGLSDKKSSCALPIDPRSPPPPPLNFVCGSASPPRSLATTKSTNVLLWMRLNEHTRRAREIELTAGEHVRQRPGPPFFFSFFFFVFFFSVSKGSVVNFADMKQRNPGDSRSPRSIRRLYY